MKLLDEGLEKFGDRFLRPADNELQQDLEMEIGCFPRWNCRERVTWDGTITDNAFHCAETRLPSASRGLIDSRNGQKCIYRDRGP